MPLPSNDSRDFSLPPRFENLEERLLLTTLIEGQTFIYQNTDGNAVRVDLIDDPNDGITASCELFTTIWDGGTHYLSQLPGFFSTPNTKPYDDVWPPNNERKFSWTPSFMDSSPTFIDWDAKPPTIEWQSYDEDTSQRAATVEIYAIYFSTSTSSTTLVLSVMEDSDLGDDFIANREDLSVWDSDTMVIDSPDDSGGVIVGAIAEDVDLTSEQQTYIPASSYDILPTLVLPKQADMGKFPGGTLRPGITISSTGFIQNNDGVGDLGEHSAALASDSTGVIISVDSNTLMISLVGPGQPVSPAFAESQITLGGHVKGIAADSTGLLYAANNTLENVDFFADASAGSAALAADGEGNFYFVDPVTSDLIKVALDGTRDPIGRVESSASVYFDNITALDFDLTDDKLYAVGRQNSFFFDSDQYLIRIDPGTGKVEFSVRINDGQGNILDPGVGTISSIAFNPADNKLYAVDASDNRLVTIELSSGEVTELPVITNAAGITGIDFIGSTLYAVTSEDPGNLYTIDTGTAVATAIGTTDMHGATALAYDASYQGALFTLASDKDFNGFTNSAQIGRIALGSAIVTSDDQGNTNWLSHLYDANDANVVFTDVGSLAFDSNDNLWGMAHKLDLATFLPIDITIEYLIQIDPDTGAVLQVVKPVVAVAGAATNGTYDGMAFDATDTLYIIDGDLLSTIDTATGVVTDIAGLSGESFVGIVFEGGALYGVTATKLFAIDHTNPANVTELADLGSADIAGLTVDPDLAGRLWTTAADTGGYRRAASLPLSATLKSVTIAGVTNYAKLIMDGATDGIAYKDFHALDYDSFDVLWGIGTPVDVRPYDGFAPPAAGAYLLKLDPVTGLAERVTPIDQPDLISIAFDQGDTIYGITLSNELVILNPADGSTQVIAKFKLSGVETAIVGIEFAGPNDTLYGVSAPNPTWASLYSIDPADAALTLEWELTNFNSTAGFTTVTGIAEDPTDPGKLLLSEINSVIGPDGSTDMYNLASVVINSTTRYHDFGRIALGGTLAGGLFTAGSIENIEMGFLWGSVLIDQNLGDLIVKTGAGAYKDAEWAKDKNHYRDIIAPSNTNAESSMVIVGGTARMIDFRGDPDNLADEFSWTGVQVNNDSVNDPSIARPNDQIYEVEVGVDNWEDEQLDGAWLNGFSSYYNNDRKEFAQYVSHQSGEFWIYGDIVNEVGSPNPGGLEQGQDWYAAPLMAGQTIEVDLMVLIEDPNNVGVFIYAIPTNIGYSTNQIRLYDFDGNWVDSWGYETEEDEGLRSLGSTFEPMVFTAPAAGIYYLVVMSYTPNNTIARGTHYRVHVQNGPDEALGGLNVVGSYDPSAKGNVGSDTLTSHVSVLNGGGIGAVVVWEELFATDIHSQGYGDLVSVYGGTIGREDDDTWWRGAAWRSNIISDSNIGMVSAFDDTDVATEGWLYADIIAGYDVFVEYNHNAHIQNIFAAVDFEVTTVSATGSIGTIETIGSLFGGGYIQADSDYDISRAHPTNGDDPEPAGNIDLIRVHFNLGGELLRDGGTTLDVYAPVAIYTNPGGDVKFLSVDGDIYSFSTQFSWELQSARSISGQTIHLTDDAGGQMWITPLSQEVVDPTTGLPFVDPITLEVILDPLTGQVPIWYSSIEVYQYGINDYIQGGVGGAIARIKTDGPVEVRVEGVVQVGNWDISWGWNEFDPDTPLLVPENPLAVRQMATSIRLVDEEDAAIVDGDLHVYYLHDSADTSANTGGKLIGVPGTGAYNFEVFSLLDSSAGGDVHLVSGFMSTTRVQTMNIGGDLGAIDHVTTGAWIFGHDDAPEDITEIDIETEIAFGWFHNKLQGLRIDAADFIEDIVIDPLVVDPITLLPITESYLRRALNKLSVGGSLRDLYVLETIGTVKVSSDGQTDFSTWDGWEGVEGVIWSGTRIDKVFVGDGLAEDGSGWAPEAGIFSGGSIGKVVINRAYYEIAAPVGADVNTMMKYRFHDNGDYFNGGGVRYAKRYGLLDGAIIAMNSTVIYETDDSDLIATSLRDPVTNLVTLDQFIGVVTLNQIEVHGISRIIGSNGAKNSAIMAVASLHNWRAYEHVSWGIFGGGIGTVEFTGFGSELNGASVLAAYLIRLETSNNSFGINYSHFDIMAVRDTRIFPIEINTLDKDRTYGIGNVYAGGPGIFRSTFAVTGSRGGIRQITGTGGAADIIQSRFLSTTNIRTIQARDMIGNHFTVTGTISDIYATGVFQDHKMGQGYHVWGSRNSQLNLAQVNAGAIGSFKVGGDAFDNDINIAGELTSMRVYGDFDSDIDMYGPTEAYLKSLVVTGYIGGQITSQGDIGKIISLNHGIWADIRTIPDSYDSNLGTIEAELGIFGALDISGSVGEIISHTWLGNDPKFNHAVPQLFRITGDLGKVRAMGDLFADFEVYGNIGTIDVDGTLYSEIVVRGDLNKLIVDGALGGFLGGDFGGNRGELDIYGDLNLLKFDATQNMVADILLGGSLAKLTLRGGNLDGDITSRNGSIGKITVYGGSITGDLTAERIGTIQVITGSITGDITSTAGSITKVYVKNGDLTGDVTSQNGKINYIKVTGNVTGDINGGSGIKKLYVYGNLSSDVSSDGSIDYMLVRGDMSGQVSAEGEIKKITVNGDISGGVRSGSKIVKLIAGRLTAGSIISSAWDINSMTVRGNVTGSMILAGYDVGIDGIFNNGDDNLNNNGDVHSGNIKKLTIRGIMSGSIVAAGIDPGADDNYLTTADNVEAAGVSSINKMTVGDGFADIGNSAILADTMIYSKLAISAQAAGVTVSAGVDASQNPVNGGVEFGQGTPQGSTIVSGGLRITLKGPGTARYEVGTGNLALYGTTSKSSLTIKNTGASVTVHIDSADDSGLRTLKTSGIVLIGDVAIDGAVGTLSVYGTFAEAYDPNNLGNGTIWSLPGGVRSAKIGGDVDNVHITAGYLSSWRFMGSYDHGDFSADAVRSLKVYGNLAGNFGSYLGEARTITVYGSLTGDITANGAIRTLKVSGSLTGDVTVVTGDLRTLTTGGSLTGNVMVSHGLTRTVTIRSGSFGADATYRTSDGVRTFKVTRGDFAGLLSSVGDLRSILATKGSFEGKVWSGGSIRSVKFYDMDGGMLSSSGDIRTVKITRDMLDSWILAGFNPGDAGFADPNSPESANIVIDAFTNGPDLNADNADSYGGGTIRYVYIGGDMGRTYNANTHSYTYAGSTIAAGLDPGDDGYFGIGGDTFSGTGYVTKVRVRGGIYGSGGVDESYGVYAASEMPVVYHHYRQPFESNYNASVGFAISDVTLN